LGNLKSNEPLIYERVDGVVYARYQTRPEIPRWIIGGDEDALCKATGNLFSWSEWQDMMKLSKTNPTLELQMKKLLDIYYIIKDDK
jgi:hypothetical protein